MKIVIETIPHKDHRYDTVGDWYFDKDEILQIKVSNLYDWRKEALIAVHELVEALMCKSNGICQSEVDAFDKNFETYRTDDSEPGDHYNSPYKKQHCIATGIERILAPEIGVDWWEYGMKLSNLPKVDEK